MAVNGRRYNRRTGSWADKPPVFHQVVVFNGLATNAAATLAKGMTVTVTGELADDSKRVSQTWLVPNLAPIPSGSRYDSLEPSRSPHNG